MNTATLPMLIDTHCHLDAANCSGGPEPAIERARAAGVGAFVAVGVGSLAATREVLGLAGRRQDVVATVGVHPHDAASLDEALFEELRGAATSADVVAIGEIGLDFHYEHSPRGVQDTVFRRFLALAREVRKPVVIHTREAPEETLRILESEGAREVGGVIHCFSEDVPFARRALDLGFDLSFSGILTFKNAVQIQEAARFAPDDRILLETDSPYLSPVPLRGKPNEPAYIVHTAARLAGLRGLSVDQVGQLTTENAIRRFGPRLDVAATSGQNRR